MDDWRIREFTGALIYGTPSIGRLPFNKYAEITYENDFYGLEKPVRKIIKMAKSEHVDNFFNKGTLQLGTFEYYRNHESTEVKDQEEGANLLVGQNSTQTAIITLTGGFDQFLFCCFDGDPDPSLIERFGYDSHFEIVDPVGFQNAISERLSSISSHRSKCIYKKDKVLVSKVNENFNFGVLSSHMEQLGNVSKHFIKNRKFEHQNEYRFTWQLPKNLEGPIIMDFPEAIKYCKR